MKHLGLIAVGGALGAMLRHGTSLGVHAALGRGFPYGTLTVNVVGSLLMGLLYVLLLERATGAGEYRALLLIGFLGAFTTFSSYSIETLELIERGRVPAALGNTLANVLLCLGACWLGLVCGRRL